MTLPQAAIDAAQKSVRDGYGVMADVLTGQIRYALEAAAPHIAAAERERIRQLAIKTEAVCWTDALADDPAPFADLLTERTPDGS